MLSTEDRQLLDRLKAILPALETARSRGQLSSYIKVNLNDVKQVPDTITLSSRDENITAEWFFIGDLRATVVDIDTLTVGNIFNMPPAVLKAINVTTVERLALTPDSGWIVYDTDIEKLFVYTSGWEEITSI